MNHDAVAFVRRLAPKRSATPDIDATLVETHKSEALYGYMKMNYRAASCAVSELQKPNYLTPQAAGNQTRSD